MRDQPFSYAAQSSHHGSIAQVVILGQHDAGTSLEGLLIFSMSHEIVFP
jgi:hypothetical protein